MNYANFLPFFAKMGKIASGTHQSIFLVGGFLRDCLLAHESQDIDLVVEGSAFHLGQTLAAELDATLIPLDRERDIYRLIVPTQERRLQLDIEGLNGLSFASDLVRRDFTINAMALSIGDWSPDIRTIRTRLIDPLNGLSDLDAKLLRSCNPQIFVDDPLRALRAVRLSLKLSFHIETATLGLMRAMPTKWNTVASERLGDEWMQLLSLPSCVQAIDMLSQLDLLPKIFPEVHHMRIQETPYPHVDNLWIHCENSLTWFERIELPKNLQSYVTQYCSTLMTKQRARLPVLRLACLFHDVAELSTKHTDTGVRPALTIAKRLALSTKESQLFTFLIQNYMYPFYLYSDGDRSSRAFYRLYHHLGADTLGCLLLSLAVNTSTLYASGQIEQAQHYTAFIHKLLTDYVETYQTALQQPPLLDGKQICRLFGLAPSSLIGKLLNKLLEAQALGEVQTEHQAIAFVEREILTYKQQG